MNVQVLPMPRYGAKNYVVIGVDETPTLEEVMAFSTACEAIGERDDEGVFAVEVVDSADLNGYHFLSRSDLEMALRIPASV